MYSTGLTNTHLNISTVAMWIMNAVAYAVVFCLIWFNAVYPSFVADSLYEMGTTIYVGLVFAMHLKVGFIHHMWNQIHGWSMFISVGGLILFLYILNSMENDNYNIYFVVNKIYSSNLFWFFGAFSVPLICVLIDVIGHSVYFIFAPSREMLYREAALEFESSRNHARGNPDGGYASALARSSEDLPSLKMKNVDGSKKRGSAIIMTSIYEDNSSKIPIA